MKFSKNFFVNHLGFDFNNNLKPKENFYLTNTILQNKLVENLFFYHNEKNKTSFYLITTILNSEEFEIIRRYFWNENKANLFFYIQNPTTLELFDAKASPKISLNSCRLDTFSLSKVNLFEASPKERTKIEKIKRWKFDNGTFWENYYEFLKKAKYKRIDKELVQVLEKLKEELNKCFNNVNGQNEIVQVLIDRTLYIKYLEDNHIVNSDFYNHYFDDDNLSYKSLLFKKDKNGLNKLFKNIHKIFNNGLFDKPTIKSKYLSDDVCNLIYQSFNTNFKTKQLRLFDFQFDIIPVEFISYIYEIFLTDKQKENGIFYTPKKLAQLIVDDVIPKGKIGKVLDPACGSGMFLIVAFQRLLENSNEEGLTDIEKIEHRTELLAKNIFGIEKEKIAQRFTLFSLSLQIFRGLDADKIKAFIANQLAKNKAITLFKKYSFFNNILCKNSLEIEPDKTHFNDETFDYIVGNPPFFEIKESHKTELNFIKKYELEIDDVKLKAEKVIGTHQISQCFLLKIKDWSNINTRFGIVSNSSSFYNDKSNDFQDFFYRYYTIEKIYELSKVKQMLFEKAKESVVSLIFSNQSVQDNIIEYYPIEKGIFSEKPFELLIVEEARQIDIVQIDLLNRIVGLRDYLVGNEFDRAIVNKLAKQEYIQKYLDENQSNHRGLERIENEKLYEYFGIDSKLERKELRSYHSKFAYENYLADSKKSSDYQPYIYDKKCISPFFIINDFYIDITKINRENFRRDKAIKYFEKPKILFNRFGNRINAALANYFVAYSTYIYVLIVKKAKYLHLLTALINSELNNYYLNLFLKKRLQDSFSNLTVADIKKIPIPKHLDEDLVQQISKISKDLTDKKYKYTNKVANELNELIYDLYDLSYWEKQRIKDYFLKNPKGKVTNSIKSKYETTIKELLQMYFEQDLKVKFSTAKGFNLLVAKVTFEENSNTPMPNKVQKYILDEIFQQNSSENILAFNEKIFDKNCVYFIKKDERKNWTETKAFEDGQAILKNIFNS